MKSLYVLTALAAFNFVSAQKTISLDNFKGIDIGEDMKVILVKSNENKLVTTNEGEDEVKVSNHNGLLVLNGYDSEVTLYYKGILETIIVDEDATLSGNDEIKTKELKLVVGDDAVVDLNVNVQQLATVIKDDAVLTLNGKAANHSADVKDDAVLKGANLMTVNTTINLSADAVASITVSGMVSAVAGSDSSLKISGKPKKVNKSVGEDASVVLVD
jgi:hypothetical protein